MKYGDKVFLDTRNNENMNCINMQYMTFVVIDGNKEMIPASESFVFQESKELYGVVVNFTLDMTPHFAKESVKLGFSDLFISPQDAKMWFPNVTWLVDTYHFCSPSKKDSVLAKSFGPKFWHLIANDMRAAVYADTEDDCLACIEAAIAKVSSSQATIDNIVQWQDRRSDWAMYKRNDVKGHMCISGPYAEQNHSSLVALVKDDKNRTLEVNIRDVMRRTELIVQKKQQANFKHQAEAHNDLLRIEDSRRREDLRNPRLTLCRKMFAAFVAQYDLLTAYNCTDEIIDGIPGTRICHTSNSSEGYFIADAGMNGVGEECPCDTEKSYTCCCRHFCAKRRHRGEPPFCKANVDPRHIFELELPMVKRGVQLNETNFDVEVPVNAAFDALDVEVPPAAARGTSSTDTANARDELVFMSPSKAKTRLPPPAATTDMFLKKKPLNVGYNVLNDMGSRLAKAAAQHSNIIQNIFLSALSNFTDMAEKMDFDSEKYVGTPYEIPARQLSLLSKQDEASQQAGMPKAKCHDAFGTSTYRKGSDKCTTTGGKRPKSCSFCKNDTRSLRPHQTMATCDVKRNLGECTKLDTNTRTEVGEKMTRICNGDEGGFGDLSKETTFNNHIRVDSLPRGTKRIQIKAYGGRYLFCTLLNDRGWPLCVNQGHTTVAYENVFVSEIGAIQGIQKCDYIFYKQMQVPLVTCSSRPIVEVASSTQTRVADDNNASSDSDDDIILSDLARTSTLKNANAKRTSESTDLQEHPAKRPNSNQK